MREALELVKRELGRDAVILGTRTLPAGRLGALTGRQLVEITAAPAGPTAGAPRLKGSRPEPSVAVAEPPACEARARPQLPEHLYPYYVRLVQNEVAEELARRLVQAAAGQVPGAQQADPEAIRAALCRYVARTLPPTGGIELRDGLARRVALVGPPGSGKTTTLAKLAAHFKLREGKRVALLSLDTQRLAAAEQLRRYAEVIQVVLRTAQSVAEVRQSVRELEPFDLLLIDTPGVGLREQGRFARLAVLLRATRPDEIHLVLPASLCPEIQERTARSFAPLNLSRMVLTRLDEVVGLGVILNLAQRLNLGVSYLTSGQNVPQDFEEACGQKVAELLLAGPP